jgi:hypothetical protein
MDTLRLWADIPDSASVPNHHLYVPLPVQQAKLPPQMFWEYKANGWMQDILWGLIALPSFISGLTINRSQFTLLQAAHSAAVIESDFPRVFAYANPHRNDPSIWASATALRLILQSPLPSRLWDTALLNAQQAKVEIDLHLKAATLRLVIDPQHPQPVLYASSFWELMPYNLSITDFTVSGPLSYRALGQNQDVVGISNADIIMIFRKLPNLVKFTMQQVHLQDNHALVNIPNWPLTLTFLGIHFCLTKRDVHKVSVDLNMFNPIPAHIQHISWTPIPESQFMDVHLPYVTHISVPPYGHHHSRTSVYLRYKFSWRHLFIAHNPGNIPEYTDTARLPNLQVITAEMLGDYWPFRGSPLTSIRVNRDCFDHACFDRLLDGKRVHFVLLNVDGTRISSRNNYAGELLCIPVQSN